MLKIDTENPKGAFIELKGTPLDIAVEYSAVGRSIFRTLKEKDKAAGITFMINVMRCFEGILTEDIEEMEKKHSESKNDIRRSEFDSDEEFKKWFHGGNEDES